MSEYLPEHTDGNLPEETPTDGLSKNTFAPDSFLSFCVEVVKSMVIVTIHKELDCSAKDHILKSQIYKSN